jgi:hypothetical protein
MYFYSLANPPHKVGNALAHQFKIQLDTKFLAVYIMHDLRQRR